MFGSFSNIRYFLAHLFRPLVPNEVTEDRSMASGAIRYDRVPVRPRETHRRNLQVSAFGPHACSGGSQRETLNGDI